MARQSTAARPASPFLRRQLLRPSSLHVDNPRHAALTPTVFPAPLARSRKSSREPLDDAERRARRYRASWYRRIRIRTNAPPPSPNTPSAAPRFAARKMRIIPRLASDLLLVAGASAVSAR
ncbi:uncharacterized protein JCM10292_004331 [Rhodotorula paludigena]|uniref:uncharacterized protein n=1 Tax=Rhodotorula paludigena TaxID=86838 RepID=UPI0031702877